MKDNYQAKSDRLLGVCFVLAMASLVARAEVTVTNLVVTQRPGTKLVDISYDVSSTETNAVTVSLTVSNGTSAVSCPSVSGDVGAGVATGTGRSIVWDGGADADGLLLENVTVSVCAVSEGGTISGDYLVIDLSAGASASNYPVSSLAAVPPGGWTDEFKTTKLVLRRIPAGSFTMGSPTDELGRYSSETQHAVTLAQDYYLGVFEVTQRQWELVMGNKPSYFNNATYYATRPVEQVSYYDIRENPANSDDPAVNWPANATVNANSFMGKLRAKTGLATFDLPTESQWEYACRAGTTTALNSGKNLTSTDSDANMNEVGRYWYNGGSGSSSGGNTSVGTAAAGSYLPNEWGLYDMHGNAWEWCLDWYGTYPGAASDPVGAVSGSGRVRRGGGWSYDARYCRSAIRGDYHPAHRFSSVGLRVCSAPPVQ